MSTTPKVNVSVNFGDGTGEQIWSREDPRHLWVHQYQTPGFYWVSVSSMDIVHPYIYQYIGYFDFPLNGPCPYFGYFNFNILLAARNVYDLTGDNVRFEVEVVDPIVDNMGMEVSMM